jgi:hypothetical protein
VDCLWPNVFLFDSKRTGSSCGQNCRAFIQCKASEKSAKGRSPRLSPGPVRVSRSECFAAAFRTGLAVVSFLVLAPPALSALRRTVLESSFENALSRELPVRFITKFVSLRRYVWDYFHCSVTHPRSCPLIFSTCDSCVRSFEKSWKYGSVGPLTDRPMQLEKHTGHGAWGQPIEAL